MLSQLWHSWDNLKTIEFFFCWVIVCKLRQDLWSATSRDPGDSQTDAEVIVCFFFHVLFSGQHGGREKKKKVCRKLVWLLGCERGREPYLQRWVWVTGPRVNQRRTNKPSSMGCCSLENPTDIGRRWWKSSATSLTGSLWRKKNHQWRSISNY